MSMLIDPTRDEPVTLFVWRYVPGEMIFRVPAPAGMQFAMMPRPVTGLRVHQPGTHPVGCPLRASCWALEVLGLDAIRPRWFGFEAAPIITSELRLAVLSPVAFEEMQRWEIVPGEIACAELALNTAMEA